MLQHLKDRLDRHAEQFQGQRPIRSPGMLTSVTTRGIIHRPKPQRSVAQPQSTKPRWG
jgi:hypothetical protein